MESRLQLDGCRVLVRGNDNVVSVVFGWMAVFLKVKGGERMDKENEKLLLEKLEAIESQLDRIAEVLETGVIVHKDD